MNTTPQLPEDTLKRFQTFWNLIYENVSEENMRQHAGNYGMGGLEGGDVTNFIYEDVKQFIAQELNTAIHKAKNEERERILNSLFPSDSDKYVCWRKDGEITCANTDNLKPQAPAEVLTTKAMAERMGVSDRQVRRLIKSGELSAFRRGKDWMVVVNPTPQPKEGNT